ncbi:polysaccharide pyruvyl transferase family protein [Clostridium cibarium]|uniref:Polysaccharide pyruvyl transferase family protein n=1 Tax=Clostridium cibarium TaxID=2762247 RepID=A0ABR8PYQ7_9CLOT|nr:polysaccharide pyruvyl transferase family protein [Clostridium cibarium]MBD7913313.1 polysaccharide pyruvyl transferase family protein [Clostridium cibarium]
MLDKIKAFLKLILKPIVYRVHKKVFKYRLYYYVEKKRGLSGKCIFLMATPCHGNLGDQAIVYAEYKFLTNMGLENQLIEIKNSEYYKFKDIIKKEVIADDIILIDGGGNLGTLWPGEDDKISEIIENFNDNKIVIFPQTCFYSDDFEGKKRLERSKSIYGKHNNLTIALRDRQSYEFVCRNFPSVKSVYTPDIVLYIDDISRNFDRSGILLCFRKDLEKVVSEKEIDQIKEYIKVNNIPCVETDTIICKKVTKRNRNRELYKKWNEFSSAGLVVTDRLHGMIFAAITGTPCIAVDNKSKKVSGVYSWISSLQYIKVCDDITKVKDDILNLYKCNAKYDKNLSKDNYDEISNQLIISRKKKQLSENQKTAINLVSSIIVMAITIMVNFFLSPYIVKHLGAEANGFTQLANNFIMYASLITIALNSMAGRFITIQYHKGKVEKANSYYSSVIIGNIFILLLFILPSIMIVMNLDKIINISESNVIDAKLLFAFVFANFFMNQIYGILSISMYVTNKLYISNLINLIKTIFNGICLLSIFYFFSARMYYVGLIGLLMTIVTLPFSLIIKRRILPRVVFYRKIFNFKYLKNLISSGIWNTINQCGNILMTGLDLLFANLFINPVQMGLLSVAKIIPNTIIQIASTINTNFSPNLTITYAKNDRNELINQVRTSMKISSVLISIPIMVFCIFGADFYILWMPTMDAKSLTILSLLTFMAFIPFAGPQVLYNVFTTTNKLCLNSTTFLIAGFFNFIIVFVLLKCTNLGVYAVAGVSSSITIFRNLLFTVPYTARLLGLKWYEFFKDVGVSVVCCLIVGIISFVIKSFVAVNSWYILIIVVAISSVLSFLANIVIVLNKNEKKNLLKKFRRRRVYG